MIKLSSGGQVLPVPKGEAARLRVEKHAKKIEKFLSTGYVPHPGQLLLHTSEARRIAASSGRQGGKTRSGGEETAYLSNPDWGVEAMRERGIDIPDGHGMLLACIAVPEIKSHRAAPRIFMECLERQGLVRGRDFREYKQDGYIDIYKNGRNSDVFLRVQIKGVARDPDRIRSEGYVWLWFDEPGFLPNSEAWEAALPALGRHKGIAFFTTSPGREENNLWFWDTFLNLENQDERIEAIEWWTEDNTFFDRETIEEARRTNPVSVFKREYQATWEIDKGNTLQPLWLKYYDRKDLHLKKGGDIDLAYYDTYIGVDPAISVSQTKGADPDYTVAVVLAKDKETGQGYLIDMRRERITAPEQVDLIHELYLTYRPHLIGIESIAYQRALVQFLGTIETIRESSIVPIMASGKKEDRLPSLGAIMRSGAILLDERMDTRDSDGNLVFDAFFQEWREFPQGKHDDTLDALDITIRTSGVFGIRGDAYVPPREESKEKFNPRVLTPEMTKRHFERFDPDDQFNHFGEFDD